MNGKTQNQIISNKTTDSTGYFNLDTIPPHSAIGNDACGDARFGPSSKQIREIAKESKRRREKVFKNTKIEGELDVVDGVRLAREAREYEMAQDTFLEAKKITDEIENMTPSHYFGYFEADSNQHRKSRSKLDRIISAYAQIMYRHHDKMLVLCKQGRYQYNLGPWDKELYRRQRVALENATRTLRIQLEDFFLGLCLMREAEKRGPWIFRHNWYVGGAEYALKEFKKQYCNTFEGIKDEFEFYVKLVRVALGLRLQYGSEFDEKKARPNDRKEFEAQADEGVKSAASPAPAVDSKAGAGGKPAPAKPVTKGEQKESLVMADTREVQKGKIETAKLEKKTGLTEAEVPWDIESIAKRPMMIDRFGWNTTNNSFSELKQYVLPNAYFSAGKKGSNLCNNLTATAVMSMYGLTRFNMRVRVQVNTTKFQAGLLLVYFKPFYLKDREAYGAIEERNYLQFPHVFVDASRSNSGELEIPFTNPRDYFPVYRDPHLEYTYFGTLHVMVWNQMKTGENTSTTASVTVWAELRDFELYQLCNPKPIDQIFFTDKIMDGTIMDPKGTDYTSVTTVPMSYQPVKFEWAPQMLEGVMGAAEALVTKTVGDLSSTAVESLLGALTVNSSDKPTSQMVSLPVVPRIADNCALAVGVDSSQRLSLEPITVTLQKGKVRNTSRPATMKDLVKSWSRINTFNLGVDDDENKVLFTAAVGPMSPTQEATLERHTMKTQGKCWLGGDQKYEPYTPDSFYDKATVSAWATHYTNLGYFAPMYYYWRGAIKYKFQAVRTDMHSARLFICYEPMGTDKTAVGECERLATPGVVWDLQEQSEIEIEAPYMATQPYMSTQQTPFNLTPANRFYGETYNGIIQLRVMNKMKRTTGVSSAIDINVYIAGGDDFEYACLREMNGIAMVGNWGGLGSTVATITTNDNQVLANMLWDAVMFFVYQPKNYKLIPTEVAKVDGGEVIYILGNSPIGMFAEWFDSKSTIEHALSTCLFGKTYALKIHKAKLDDNTQAIRLARCYTYEEAWRRVHSIGALPLAVVRFQEYATDRKLPGWQTIAERARAWMAHVLLDEGGFHHRKLPTTISLPISFKPTEWIAQSNDTAKGPVINPFKQGVKLQGMSNIARFGEDHMNIENICRRFYHVRTFLAPESHGNSTEDADLDVGIVADDFFKFQACTPAERDRMILQLAFPVMPNLQPHTVGTGGSAFTIAPYQAATTGDYRKYNSDLGMDSLQNSSWNPIYHLSQRFSFWKGSLRYKLVFPRTQVQSVMGDRQTWTGENMWAVVVHVPTSFVENDYVHGNFRVRSEQWMRDMQNHGAVLYNSNISGSMEFEVPYYSKYNQLAISNYTQSEITTNGTVYIFLPMTVFGDLKSPVDIKQYVAMAVQLRLYMSVGADFEFFIPRPAPLVSVWDGLVESDYQSKQQSNPKCLAAASSVSSTKDEGKWGQVVKMIPPNVGIDNPILSMNETVGDLSHWTFGPWTETLSRFAKEIRKLDWSGASPPATLAWEAESLETEAPIRKDLVVQEDEVEPLEDDEMEELEPVTDSEEEVEYDSEEYTSSEIDSLTGLDYYDWANDMEYAEMIADAPYDWVPEVDEEDDVVDASIMDAVRATRDFSQAAASAKSAMKNLDEIVTMAGPMLTTLSEGVNKAGGAIEKVTATIDGAANYSINAARLVMFAHGAYRCLQGESWTDRWMAVAECALALGLEPSLILKVGEWLMTSLSAIIGSGKVNEDLPNYEAQNWEDMAEETWTAFVLRHESLLKMIAASVGAIAAFYFTTSAPPLKDITSFSTQAINKLRNFAIVGSAVKSFDWLFNWIAKVITDAVTWSCDKATGGMLTCKVMADMYPTVYNWLNRVDQMQCEQQRTACLWDPEVRNNMWKLMDEGNGFVGRIKDKSSLLASTVARGLTMLERCHTSYAANKTNLPFRIDPWAVWVSGPPGLGKSAVLTQILDFTADELDLANSYRFYTRCEKDEYWSNYVGQPVVQVDDICQNRKGHAILEWVNMKSNVQYMVPMAHLEEKGRNFSALLLGATSNLDYPEPADVADPHAIWRRREVFVRIIPPSNLVNFNSSSKKSDFSHLKFEIVESNPAHASNYRVLRTDLNINDVKQLCAISAKDWIQRQRALVFSTLKGRHIFSPEVGDTKNILCDLRQKFLAELAMRVRNHIEITSQMLSRFKEEITLPDLLLFEKLNPVAYRALVRGEVGDQILKLIEVGTITNLDLEIHEAAIRDGNNASTSRQGMVAEAWTDEEVEAKAILRRAENDTLRRGKLSDMYNLYHEQLKKNMTPEGLRHHVADEKELREFLVSTRQADSKIIDQLTKDYTTIFNSVSLAPNQGAALYVNERIEALIGEKYLCWWRKEEGHWTFHIPEDIEDWDAECYYEELCDIMSQAQIDSLLEGVKQDVTPNKLGSALTRLGKWGAKMKQQVVDFFDNHPHIVTLLKVLGALSGIFVGYKVLSYLAPGVMEKINVLLLGLFGFNSSEEIVTSVKERGCKVAKRVKDAPANLYEWVRSLMLSSKDPETQEMAAESGTVKLMADELVRLMPAAKSSVTSKKMLEEAKTSKLNAYMIGTQDTKRIDKLAPYHPQLMEVTVNSVIPRYRAEGANDQNAYDLRVHSLMTNMVRVFWIKPDGNVRREAAVFVRSRTLLMPWHFFDSIEENTIFQIRKGAVTFQQSFDSKRLVRFPACDACLYECSLRVGQFRAIDKHFMRESELSVGKTRATLNVLTESDGMLSWITDAELDSDVEYCLESGTKVLTSRVWQYEAITNRGDCGAVLMADNPSIAHKLMGIHVAGLSNQNFGASAVITFEMLTGAFKELPPDSPVVGNLWLQQCVDQKESRLVVMGVDRMKVIPSGNFELIGAVASNNEVQLPRKSEIIPSPIFDMVRKHSSEPSVLVQSDPRLEEEGSPLVRAISKYGISTTPFCGEDIRYVSSAIRKEIFSWEKPMGTRLLSDWEAVFGNEFIDFCDRMNLGASPGYPYIKDRPSGEMGKAYLYDINSENGIANKDYEKNYYLREGLAKAGIRMVSLWTDCLKDERRPIAKIRCGKTRAFVLPPADFTQLFRKYFMAFCVCFYANHNKSFSAVGMDPYSFEWTMLYRYLGKNSNLAFGGDFSSFDGILDAELMWEVFRIIDEWYDDEYTMIRAVLFEELIHTYHICVNSVYQTHQGNPSGSPLTVIKNTIVHKFKIMLAWIALARKHSPEHMMLSSFYKNVKDKYYGDDGLYTVTWEVAKWFNLNTVSEFFGEHGIIYTDELKLGDNYGVRPLRKGSFLKNKFRRLPDSQLWLAALSEDSVYELTNWVRKSPDIVEALKNNLEDALGFAFHHGRDFYDGLLEKINTALKRVKLREIADSFEHRKEMFMMKCQR